MVIAVKNASQARRRYIRHPTEIPLEVSAASTTPQDSNLAHDISYGGLSFASEVPFKLHDIIQLTIHLTRPSFAETAKVVWCHQTSKGYEIGVEFTDPDAPFRARMVEQVCHIEQFRREKCLREKRDITTQQAAMEWIARYAADFPCLDDQN